MTELNTQDYNINVAGIVPESITDGPGIRFTLFVQGCPRHCEGCHNAHTIPFEGGEIIRADEIFNRISKNPLLSGVTFSGGEPFCKARSLSYLAKKIKDCGLELAIYTGYLFEELIELAENDEYIKSLILLSDIIVDGPFILSKRSLAIPFKGSKNQRIINVGESLRQNQVVIETSDRWNGI